MPIESLFQLIQELADRIQKHSSVLRQNEMLTRYVLIDPLLRELGWDTENPDQVRPEYAPGSGRVDYALMHNGKAIIMVEAKKLDTPLKERLGQAIQYCLTEGTPFFSVTDGRRWEIYETHRPVPMAEKLVVAFDLADHSSANVAFKAMALWRHSIETGKAQLPHVPIHHVGEVEATSADERPKPTESSPAWTIKGSSTGKPIGSFTFVGKKHSVNTWKELLVSLATILYGEAEGGFQRVLSLRGRKRVYFTHDPNQLREPVQVAVSGYYVETRWSADNMLRRCAELLVQLHEAGPSH